MEAMNIARSLLEENDCLKYKLFLGMLHYIRTRAVSAG